MEKLSDKLTHKSMHGVQPEKRGRCLINSIEKKSSLNCLDQEKHFNTQVNFFTGKASKKDPNTFKEN